MSCGPKLCCNLTEFWPVMDDDAVNALMRPSRGHSFEDVLDNILQGVVAAVRPLVIKLGCVLKNMHLESCQMPE